MLRSSPKPWAPGPLAATTSSPSPLSQKPSRNLHMTANDFFLLFAAFGGFVIAPALLLWGFARITHRKRGGTSSPDIRPDVDSSDASSGGGRREAARSGKANRFLRRLTGWTDTARRPCPPPRVRGSRCASLAPLPPRCRERGRRMIPMDELWGQLGGLCLAHAYLSFNCHPSCGHHGCSRGPWWARL